MRDNPRPTRRTSFSWRAACPAAEALADWPMVELSAEEVDLVRHGHRVPSEPDSPEWARALTEQGDLVALVENIDNEWQPRKVFLIE